MNRPALLLVHGFPFDHTLWDHVVALLSTEIKVLAPDLRGFGGSPLGNEEPSLGRTADDLKNLLDREQIGRAVVAGMSMGGYVALAFAEHYPARLAGLGLVSSQAAADSPEARANRRAMIEKVRREGPSAASQASIPKLFAAANVRKPEFVRFPTSAAEKAGVDGLVWAQEAMSLRPDRTAVLKSLRVPLLVVHGGDDQYIPSARAREMAGLATNSRFVEIPGGGHATPIEAPDVVAAALSDLVNRSHEHANP
jgi:pimeloyl-ACP methyl ester carboxylesterase